MQIQFRPIVLALPLAFSAFAVQAQSKAPQAPPPTTATAAQPTPPMDLNLHPATMPLSAPVDLSLHPAGTPAPASVDVMQSASEEVQRVARWVADSHDNVGLPYLLIDKVNAQVYAFNAAGQLAGTAPALLGMARGDVLKAPNSAPMSEIGPQDRITPAGRFVSRLALDSKGKELLVIDYEASISLHPVVKGTPAEHRAERLGSPTSKDNRISFGCINVPPEFYSNVVSPSFTHTRGVVYILPETRPAADLFGIHPVEPPVSATQAIPAALNAATAPALPTPDAR